MTKIVRAAPLALLVGLLFVGAPLAAFAPGSVRPGEAAAIPHRAFQPLGGSQPLALPHVLAASCDQDPVGCANALTKPITGLYRAFVLMLLIILACLVTIGLLVIIIVGVVRLFAGEPRAVSQIILAVAGLLILAVIGFKVPDIASNLAGGFHITPPPVPQATGG